MLGERADVNPPGAGAASPLCGAEALFFLTPGFAYVLVLFMSDLPASARTERHLRMLQELAEIGMDLAREVSRQALDPSGDAPSAADLALTFSRIARAVRQTVALEARLAADREQGQAGRPTLSVADRWRSTRRRRQVRELVCEVIDAEADKYDAGPLYEDLDDRLQDGDEDADFADRPIGELVARICRDLGVTPDWSLFDEDDWAIEEARNRPPGSPFAAARPGGDASEPADGDPAWAGHDPPGASSH